MTVTSLEMIIRVVLAAALGAALGAEREFQHKTAGLRTHTLVAAGAALFTVAGGAAAGEASAQGTDVTRVAAQVVTGIGFIGAGGMIRSGFTMSGITTAATLWFAAAVGVATGFGFYLVAVVGLVVALISMIGFAPIRPLMRRGSVHAVEIRYHGGHGTLTPLFETLNAIGAQVHRISMVEDGGLRTMTCEIVGIGSDDLDSLIAALRSRDEVIAVTVGT